MERFSFPINKLFKRYEMKIKGIIFDKDGTLFDIQRSWSEWAKVFVTKFSKKHGLEITKLSNAINFDLASNKFLKEFIYKI